MIEAAAELMAARHFSQAVAACRAELQVDPDDVDLRLLLARALMALRRDGEAQIEVAAALRARPRCPEAYGLLGELAFRRDELRASEIFLREALRLSPGDAFASELLTLVRSRIQPAAAAAKLPAASAAAGPFSPRQRVSRLARGTEPAPIAALGRGARLANIDDDDIPVHEGTPESAPGWKGDRRAATSEPDEPTLEEHAVGDERVMGATEAADAAEEVMPTVEQSAPKKKPAWILPKTEPGEPTVQASRAEEAVLRTNPGQSGFGEYLVATGLLSRWQLYCALHLQDWKKLRLGQAVVKLGFADKRTVERAAREYHDELAGAPFAS